MKPVKIFKTKFIPFSKFKENMSSSFGVDF